MLHGMIYARHADNLTADPGDDFARRDPRLLRHRHPAAGDVHHAGAADPGDWDDLAEGAEWSRRNAATLLDTHWIGGDPAELEPYGHAAWSPARSILVLRNPSAEPATLALDPGEALEMPPEAPCRCRFRSPWRADRGGEAVMLEAGSRHEFRLAPFEVRTLQSV